MLGNVLSALHILFIFKKTNQVHSIIIFFYTGVKWGLEAPANPTPLVGKSKLKRHFS